MSYNTSKGIRIKILVTSSGNIRNQLVYVANQNKTFERHVQVSKFHMGNLQCYFQLDFIFMYNLKTWQFMKEVSKYDGIPLFSVANGLLDWAMQANTMLYLDISKIPKTPFQIEILSVIVDWSIFFICIHLSGPKHPTKVKYFLLL